MEIDTNAANRRLANWSDLNADGSRSATGEMNTAKTLASRTKAAT